MRKPLLIAALALAVTVPAVAKPPKPIAPAPQTTPAPAPDRSSAYFHAGLAHLYEEMAIEQGRSDYATQAIENYKLALDADPNSAFLQTGLADLYFSLGRIREAVDAAQELVKKDPTNLQAHVLLGRIYLRSLGDGSTPQSAEMLKLAIAEYQTIVQLKPGDVENHLLLGQLFAMSHDSASAEAQFKAAQIADPNAEEATMNLARLYTDQGDIPRAISVLAAVPITSRSAQMEMLLGALYDQDHQTKNAADTYQLALDQDPSNLDTRRALAQALYNDHQFDAALAQYNKILEGQPTDAQSVIRIADIQRHKGQFQESLASLEKAKPLVKDPLDTNYIRYNEAIDDEALGKSDAAISVLTAALNDEAHSDGKYTDAEKGNRSTFLDNLAEIYRQTDRTDDAIACYRQMIALDGEYAERGWGGIVDAYRDARQWQKATAAAADAVKALPKSNNVALNYYAQLADTGDADHAMAQARALLGSNGGKDDRTIRLALAQMETRLKRWPAATADLDAAEPLSNKSEDREFLLFLRGSLAERQKHLDQAESFFRQTLKLDPESPATLNYLGYMLADHGLKLDEARTMLQQAVAAEPQNYAYLDSLGWAYYKLGQYALAEQYLQRALAHMHSDPTLHDHMGSIYEKEGKLSLAVAQWERSLAEDKLSLPADVEPDDVARVQKSLDAAKARLAKSSPAR
jgi:tetratricopeptide (TPR) repeat protein